MQTLFLRKELSGHTMAAIFIHDLIPAVLSAVLPDTSGFSVIDANQKAACCQGCFRCWLASPGQCVMKDDLQTVGAQIGNCEKVIILSRCCYRGFSPGVKKVLDRAISLSLPFFTYRGGHVHHPSRYQNRPTFTVCFYGAVTDFERETATRLVAFAHTWVTIRVSSQLLDIRCRADDRGLRLLQSLGTVRPAD